MLKSNFHFKIFNGSEYMLKILAFFLFLVLSLSFIVIPVVGQLDNTIHLSAGSSLSHLISGTYTVANILPGKSPDLVRFELFNPSKELVYKVDDRPFSLRNVGYGVWIVEVNKDLRVPAFALVGLWSIKITFFNKWATLDNVVATWETTFSVGESSLVDNIMAPIYLTWGGVAVVGWGSFSFALPCIFWLSSPFWILTIFFIVLAFYKKSVVIAVVVVREGVRRFKVAMKKGGNKNI